ncbi:MAG: Glu-tRNA(Gln) amidotransferase subunit GatE, partial [Candidatus Thermoplasmatota archaeon]|nr:Glu-tRNA(Gln) amidotransferase subunit GatE [Candidatus Thermoplasmatota archaeon]
MERPIPIKVGLEIHQPLATHKLFCNCESRLVDEVKEEFVRRLRPTQSELGEVDRAALEEAAKGLAFTYQTTESSCLVEADEEPPHEANRDAIETVLKVALMLGAEPVNEIHFMRKIVIDGSNTTGFQRSALVALNGSLQIDGKKIGVPTICLEEDAARLVDRKGQDVLYRLDRLGIPLIEIATTPAIDSPEMAREVALKIGRLLRATREVLRGLGTIREDINVSVEGGARVEIKGVQDLRMISTYVSGEVERQTRLLEARDVLQGRGVGSLEDKPGDLTTLLRATESKVLQRALRSGGAIMGLRLRGFRGLLAGNLGPELAAQAAVAGVGGVVHSDELPAYGITQKEVAAIGADLDCKRDDAFVLLAHDISLAQEAMERVKSRAAEALRGVPEETRDAKPDGST